MKTLVMGTRGSPLALAQSRQFARALEAAHDGLVVEEKIIRTTGDERAQASLPAIGGKGVFTLEIENALLDGSIDFAVHSLKDLPPDLPEGLTLGCIPTRESVDDVLIIREECRVPLSEFPKGGTYGPLWELRPNAKVGTSSIRRRAALLHLRPDLDVQEIRGNIDTRLRKMHELHYDAIVLAQAGLNRIGFKIEKNKFDFRLQTEYGSSVVRDFGEPFCVPAPGQGALAIECCEHNERVLTLLSALEDKATRVEITVERSVVQALGAGCSTPLGVRAYYSEHGESGLSVRACVYSPTGKERRVKVIQIFRRNENPQKIGKYIAEQLLEKGAAELLGTHE